MPHKVGVNKNLVQLPNGEFYNTGQTVILDDHEFALVNPASLTDGTLSDLGAYPPVQGFGYAGTEEVLNGALGVQSGNTTAPARYTIRRSQATTDSTSALTSTNTTVVAVALYTGDVITTIATKSGATAASTPTHYFFALYNAAGTLLGQTQDAATAAWAANTVKALNLTAGASSAVVTPVTIGATGIYYVAIGMSATTCPSLPSSVVAPVGISTGGFWTGQAVLAGNVATTTAGTADSTLGTITSQTYVPYVVLY